MATTSPPPLSTEEFTEIVNAACELALGPAEQYEHEKVGEWNSTIINTILKTLIEKTESTPADTKTSTSAQSTHKFIASSTIIQHPGHPSQPATAGRRGMHSAVGAFWNPEKDGTFSYKWDAADTKGMDVVICINWIGM